MNFSNAVCMVVLAGILSGICLRGAKVCKKVEDLTAVNRNQALSTRFISGSFTNACSGKGFVSLDQWQKSCSDLWKLDYIAWGKTEGAEGGILMFGKWGGKIGEGEVFYRLEKKGEE